MDNEKKQYVLIHSLGINYDIKKEGVVEMTKKILIIDDSALMRRTISDIIKSGNKYEVAAIAKDGEEGYNLIRSNPNEYSAIILDINMPKMNGLQLLKKLQEEHIEQTVIVVSTVAKEGAKETILALEYGAFDFVTKPENYLETKGEDFKRNIHAMLDVATGTKQTLERVKQLDEFRGTEVKRPDTRFNTFSKRESTEALREQRRKIGADILARRKEESQAKVPQKTDMNIHRLDGHLYTEVKTGKTKLVALACSTGGPKSLQHVIPLIPKNLDAGIVLVQHMPAGFTLSLAQRLDEMSGLKVKEAEDGDIVRRGRVYIAPGGKHIRIVRNGSSGHIIKLSEEAPVEGLRPCANIMYDSLTECHYDEITCVVLTGMGADGTKGIKALHDCNKNIHVIAQDENTSVVYGMPKSIAQAGLVDEIVPLDRVAEAITKNVGVS